jgi:hypothetical protein
MKVCLNIKTAESVPYYIALYNLNLLEFLQTFSLQLFFQKQPAVYQFNIILSLRKMGSEHVDWIDLDRERDKWRDLGNVLRL